MTYSIKKYLLWNIILILGSSESEGADGQPGFIRGVVRSGGQPLAGATVTCRSTQNSAQATFITTANDGTYSCTVPAGENYYVAASKALGYTPQYREVTSSQNSVNFVLFSVQYGSVTTLQSYFGSYTRAGKTWATTLEEFNTFTLGVDTSAVIPITVVGARSAAEESCFAAQITGDSTLVEAWCSRVFVADRARFPTATAVYLRLDTGGSAEN
jgi:hypothetical protein